MITANTLNATSPASSTDDQEVSLLDQIKWVTYGHPIADVMTIAIAVMQQCIVQMASDKEEALRALDAFHRAMADDIDRSYDDIRIHGALSTGMKQ